METPLPETPAKGETRTGAIIGSIAAILLCGCLGLLLCPSGIILATNALDTAEEVPTWTGYIALCLSVVGVAIGVVVPILLLRKKKPKVESAAGTPSEPIPPAS
jgi:TRAP-type C4-dicarboxylate transport system permease small subunit